jgi:hypothetical protein
MRLVWNKSRLCCFQSAIPPLVGEETRIAPMWWIPSEQTEADCQSSVKSWVNYMERI